MLIVGCAIFIVVYLFAEKQRGKVLQNFDAISELNAKMIQAEITKRIDILSRVEKFLTDAVFLSPIGTLRGEKVYKYIVNRDIIYTFEDFQSDSNAKIGINENELCFRHMSYKRVVK